MRVTNPYPDLTSRLSNATRDLEARFKEVAADVSSGRRSDQIGYLEGDIGQAMQAERAVDAIALEKDQIALQNSRLAVTQRSLEAVNIAAEGIALDVTAFVGVDDRTSLERSSEAAEVALERIFSSLNTRQGERYLFSGDATDTPPLAPVEQMMDDLRVIRDASTSSADFEASIDQYFNRPDWGWQQNIYQGTSTNSTQDQVIATDPAITDLVSGLAVVALVADTDWHPDSLVSSDVLNSASSRISNGTDGVTNVQARLGLVEADLSDRNVSLEREETVANQLLSDLTTRDPYEASVELQQLETNLETAYALTARLSELSLLNFLR